MINDKGYTINTINKKYIMNGYEFNSTPLDLQYYMIYNTLLQEILVQS